MPLRFELVTPERLVRAEDVHMVVVPGVEGEFAVLQNHAPFMTVLKDGVVRVFARDGAAAEEVRVSGGFAEVNEAGLTILAEAVTA